MSFYHHLQRSSFFLTKESFLNSIYPTALANNWVSLPPTPVPPQVGNLIAGVRLPITTFAPPNSRFWSIDVSSITSNDANIIFSSLNLTFNSSQSGLEFTIHCIYEVGGEQVSTGNLPLNLALPQPEEVALYSYTTFDNQEEYVVPGFDLEILSSGSTMSATCSPIQEDEFAVVDHIKYVITPYSIIRSDPDHADVTYSSSFLK
jgi:hypothetical protein